MKTVTPETVVRRKPKRKFFSRLAAGCSLLLLLPSARAQFTWPVYEPFNYPEAERLGTAGSSGTNWNAGNSTGTASFETASVAAMSFPALLPDGNATPRGGHGPTIIANSSRDRGATFTTHSGTIYVSFLLNYIDNGGATSDRLFFNMNDRTDASTTAYRMSAWLTPDYRLKIVKNLSSGGVLSAASPVLLTNVPHLIVMRYMSNTVGSVDLWIDPTPFGDNANIPPPILSTTNGNNVSSFTLFAIMNRKYPSAYTANVFNMDEIRLGDTWASVTPPATPAPGPLFAVSGGGNGCQGDAFPVILTGSVATNDYWLYTNSVYAGITLPGNADGSALNMGTFSAIGNYSILASNNVNGNLGWMSNSVVINVRAPVTIVAQPSPVITATNNRAQFSVACTGDELSYQWYKDGTPLADDSHRTGSRTATLVVWPATTADVGGYYCNITNPCSISANYTTTNTLTLGAPNDLVWTGDGFNIDVWDTANGVLEWNSGAAGFNAGDDVTFNDTYTYANPVTLTGVLTPTLLTVDASRDYLFGGNGVIAGTAALVKNGTGRLVLSNTVSAGVYQANSYSGGTIINNGTVYVQSAGALGTGPITLAGGTLETLGKLVFTNNVNVTANSICQLDQTGNQSITLAGGFNQSPGTTLIFTNSAATTNSPNWVVLTSPFTNNASIVLSVRDVATNSTQTLSCNISTNCQVFNGVISEVTFPGPVGGGGLIKQGAGAVYLNAVNTYTFRTTNAAGLLAGSGSIKSPLFVAAGASLGAGSPTGIGTFTVNNDATLYGNVFVRVNQSLAPAQVNDRVSVSGNLVNSGTGTVTVTNLGGTLTAGDTFTLFNKALSGGDALTITGGGVTWSNRLAVDGSIVVVGPLNSYPPVFNAPIAGTNVIIYPGTQLSLANTATDADLPAQTLAYTLLSGPAGAQVDSASGVLIWRPLVSQANSFNPINVVVTDSGTPARSATNSYSITVQPLAPINLSTVVGPGQFSLAVAATAGPDYAVLGSTNLTTWSTLFITNSPDGAFTWTDPNPRTNAMQFYRVQAQP